MLGKICRGWMLEERPVTNQLPLVEVEVETRLTPRQQAVLQALKVAEWGGLRTDAAGAIAHEMKEGRWQHSRDDRCDYCARDGNRSSRGLGTLACAVAAGKMRVWQAVAALQPEVRSPAMLPDDQPLPF